MSEICFQICLILTTGSAGFSLLVYGIKKVINCNNYLKEFDTKDCETILQDNTKTVEPCYRLIGSNEEWILGDLECDNNSGGEIVMILFGIYISLFAILFLIYLIVTAVQFCFCPDQNNYNTSTYATSTYSTTSNVHINVQEEKEIPTAIVECSSNVNVHPEKEIPTANIAECV